MSFCKNTLSSADLISLYRTQSSANNLTLLLISWVMSFIKMMNRSGPNTLPWGTPDVTLASGESLPSMITCCLRGRILPGKLFVVAGTSSSNELGRSNKNGAHDGDMARVYFTPQAYI